MIVALEVLVLLLIVTGAVVFLYIMKQGDACLVFSVDERSRAAAATVQPQRLCFDIAVPFANSGRQEGTILDAYVRIYLPQEQYDGCLLRGRVNVSTALRDDDYFEAMLVPAGQRGELLLRLEVYPRRGLKLQEAVAGLPDVDIALLAECRGRKELYTVKKYFTLEAEEVKALLS